MSDYDDFDDKDERDERDEDDEDYDEDDEDDRERDDDIVAERAAFERTGKRQELGEIITTIMMGDKKLERIQRRMLFETLSDTEKFLMILKNFSSYVFEEDIGPILDPHKTIIENMVSKINISSTKIQLLFL